MDSKGAASATEVRNRDSHKKPNPNKLAANAGTVSAAGIFKAQKLTTPLQPRPRSARKSTVTKVNGKIEEEHVHPLALTFKEKSEEYRRHLYSTAATKINKDLDGFLNRLYDSNLQVPSSDPANEDSQASPIRLTVPAKYQRTVEKLGRPLSRYRYKLQRTKPSGEIEHTQASLHGRFQTFEETIQAETEQIKELQGQWEGTVAEIFQLGVSCLGEADVAVLLSNADTTPNTSLPATKAEPTVLDPEHGNADGKGIRKRKRVSFASPDMMALFPEFLFLTSGKQEPTETAPELPVQDIQQLEKDVSVLGKQHSAELRQLEHEHKAWWEKKQKQLAHTFMQD